jgi:hypothetical protein
MFGSDAINKFTTLSEATELKSAMKLVLTVTTALIRP